ncbi:MAG TPA: hypothetical protein VFT37_14190 [Telluria sp.]|nr:hypothetical protein [Telluria sp.]
MNNHIEETIYMHTITRFSAAATLAVAALSASAADTAPAAAPATPSYTARSADVESVDGIVAALYDVISGPPGQARDWDRMHSLFMPQGRMMVVSPQKDGSFKPGLMAVEDYIARNGKRLVADGFFETEKARTTESFGQLTHVFSTYEARLGSPAAAPFARGINSIQLYHDGKRWWIASVVWRSEDDKLKLPERYLQTR